MTEPKTVTRADLAEAVHLDVGLTRRSAADIVDSVFEEITRVLQQGQTVKLSGFGNFSVRQKSERVGRNPKTGEEVPITPRRVTVFKASHILKDKVNK